jgi:threonine/homoserine/homoserine lactone efflux protein
MDVNHTYIGFMLACFIIVLLPGTTVTLIVTNSLRFGPWAGVKNVIGTQAAIAMMLFVLAFGLEAITQRFSLFFSLVQYAGAAYLAGFGLFLLLRAPVEEGKDFTSNHSNFTVQGFIVCWSNPKVLLFLGTFIPPFIDPTGVIWAQILLYGGTFMLMAIIFDVAYCFMTDWLAHYLGGVSPRNGRFLVAAVYLSIALWLLWQKAH